MSHTDAVTSMPMEGPTIRPKRKYNTRPATKGNMPSRRDELDAENKKARRDCDFWIESEGHGTAVLNRKWKPDKRKAKKEPPPRHTLD